MSRQTSYAAADPGQGPRKYPEAVTSTREQQAGLIALVSLASQIDRDGGDDDAPRGNQGQQAHQPAWLAADGPPWPDLRNTPQPVTRAAPETRAARQRAADTRAMAVLIDQISK